MKKEKLYYVYILASGRNGTLYIGMTNGLLKRGFQHKLKENKSSFSAKYNITMLVYYEIYREVNKAITREKQLKKWNRNWKIRLIEETNPMWRNFFDDSV